MIDYKQDTQPRHPIGVAATRTGIAQDVLRAWERRYGAVVPHRTPTGRRLYSNEDLIRLGLLRRLVEAGRRISDIANATTEELKLLAEEDRRALSDRQARPPEIEPASHLDAAIGAVRNMSTADLEAVLSDASLSMSLPELRRQVIVPLLHEIGRMWRSGRLRIAHERVASTLVRTFMEGMRNRSAKNSRPTMIVTTPAGQRHELGAIMAAAAAEEMGWRAVYLGADLPAEEIGVAARQLGARVVALSLVFKGDQRQMLQEIASIRRALDAEVTLIVGGRAAGGVSGLVDDTGVAFVDDLGEFQSRLETLFPDGKA